MAPPDVDKQEQMILTNSYIALKDLHFHAYHGVLAQERTVGNDYVVGVRVKVDISTAMRTDNVEDTVNYATLYEQVKAVMDIPSALLENVGYRMAEKIFNTFPTIEEAHITIRKENPPFGADSQGAEVEMHFTNEKTK